MRFLLVAMPAIIALSTTNAWAGDAITVDRVYSSQALIHVLARVSNADQREVSDVSLVCDVFAKDGTALGVARTYIKSIPAGSIAIGDAVSAIPPGSSDVGSAKCRFSD